MSVIPGTKVTRYVAGNAYEPHMAVEHRPTADYWTTLCAEHDVVLTWPEVYDDLFVDMT